MFISLNAPAPTDASSDARDSANLGWPRFESITTARVPILAIRRGECRTKGNKTAGF